MNQNPIATINSKLSCIEIDDQKIDHDLSIIIQQTEKGLQELQANLNNNDLIQLEKRTNHIEEQLIPCKKELEKLHNDIAKINQLEQFNDKQLLLKDQDFIEDKKIQIQKIQEEIQTISDIFYAHPSKIALQEELISDMEQQLHDSKKAIHSLLVDDHQLQLIYNSLNEHS